MTIEDAAVGSTSEPSGHPPASGRTWDAVWRPTSYRHGVTTDERPLSSDDMIRMAREAVESPPVGTTQPDPVTDSTAEPEPTSVAPRRPLVARRRQLSREGPPRSTDTARPEVVRTARVVASLALVIGLIVLGLAMYIALAASTP